MARRVVSVLGGSGDGSRMTDPALEANAYAVAEDVHLALVLRAAGVELAGVGLPPMAAGQDLRGLLESGVEVHVDGPSLAARGLRAADLLDGVRVVEAGDLADLLRDADAVLVW